MSINKRETAEAAHAAAYIGSLARDLRGLASKHDLGFLAYLLAMVQDEAAAAERLNREQSDAA